MSSTFKKVAAVAAASTLVISGASAANAQGVDVDVDVDATVQPGSLDMGSLTNGSSNGGSSNGDSVDGSVKAWGQSPAAGSLLEGAGATGNGSLDTGSMEPTTGSLAGIANQVSGSFDASHPAPGTGSVDTTGSILDEPTTGSLAPVWAPIAGSLGIDQGITTIIDPGSVAGTGLGSVTGAIVPVVLVGGSIAAGIAAAPMIQQALAGAGIALPPLPAIPGVDTSSLQGGAPAPAPQPAPPAAPGPVDPNGRG